MIAKIKNKGLRSAARLVLLAGAVLVGIAGFSDEGSAQGVTGIRNTKHNLSASGTAGNNKTNQGEICVFCHTPHGSATTAAAPLWNKKLADPTSYTLYTSTTLDGTVDLTNSVSLACLTCHDGTQAMDTVLNDTGSGGYNSTGARMTVSGATVTWSGTRVDTATGKLSAGIANLGTDLANDHPVGIQYAKSSEGTLDADFRTASKHATKAQWWVDTEGVGTANVRDKTDMILYTKADKPYVECASCHDPHVENATFLRIANTESKVCLTCHNK